MTAEPEKSAHAARHAATNPVSRATESVIGAFIRLMPASVRRRLETDAGKRFLRFAPVAIAALVTSQLTLAILTGLNMTAGKAALIASVVGAFVSYVLSRWAWESKGRPDLLRETVPFWLVSFAVWGILSLVTHYAGAWAKQENLHHLEKHLVVNGAYLAANCVTFVCRFLIFHYVLFAKRRKADAATELPSATAAAGTQDAATMALAGETTKQTKPQA
jgi:putative flippase GtrA